jgi:hypothetical protein
MGKRLPPEQLELYYCLDEILWTDGDPIGVHGVEQARDEYYGYLPDLLRLVLDGAPATQIATYLHGIATKRMGLSSALSGHVAVAEKIYRLEQQP